MTLEQLPVIDKIYSVTRHTVWQTVEPTHILIFVTHGSSIIESEGETTLLEEGNYMLIPKNTPYIRHPVNNTPCTMYYVHFDAHIQPISHSEVKKILKLTSKNISSIFLIQLP